MVGWEVNSTDGEATKICEHRNNELWTLASWRSLGPPGMVRDVGMSELLRMIALPAMSSLAPGSCRQQKGTCMSQVDSLACSAERAAGG